jgi:hypothetical protein
MAVNDELHLIQDAEDDDGDMEHTGTIIWNYFKSVGVQSKQGAKKVKCIFCDTPFTGCSLYRAIAHILGRPVLGQKKKNIKACVPTHKVDDSRYAQFKTAQKKFSKKK